MSLKETDNEHIILISAKEIFFKKGYDGALMQEITDEAKNILTFFISFYN